jgi:CHASE2 domain-containing sensor protein
MAIISALLMFFLSWISIFDYFNLDTRIETYTMALGEYLTTKTFSDKIIIISAEDESFGKHWRGDKHPMLLNFLSGAGADVIVFDMVFETPTEFDTNFIAALWKAKEANVDVIIGIRNMGEKGPEIVPEIEQAISGTGITCIGRKLGHARTAPLVVLDKDEDKGESEKGKFYSLALKAYAAYNDLDILDVDLKESYINLLFHAETRIHKVPFAELTKAKDSLGCPIIQKDDIVADIFIDPFPIETLREREITYAEVIDQKDLDRFKDKIVLIGSPHGDIRIKGITGKSRFGFELHAEALNTLINGVFIHSLNVGWQLVLMIILGICGALIRYRTPRASNVLRRVLAFSIVVAYSMGTILLYAKFRILLNTLYHIGAFGLSYWAAGKIERRILL